MKSLIAIAKKFLFSNYGPLIIGVIFTGLVGWGVNYLIQNQIIAREQKFEIYKKNINAAENILDKTIGLINARLFYLQRVIWTYKNAEAEDVIKDWADYRKEIAKWNINDMSYKTRLKTYFGKNIANHFLPNKMDPKKNSSVYIHFYRAHRDLLDWKTCLIKSCHLKGTEACKTNKCDKEKNKTQESLGLLRENINIYVDTLYSEYQRKYLTQE